jgi:hypothetical protein
MNLKEVAVKRLACLAALAAGTCFGLGPAISPAEAATFSLNLSGPQTYTVGQPVVFHASGTAAPPAEFWNLSWISAVVLDSSVAPTCPASAYDATGMASGTGGRIIAISLPPTVDQAGNFDNVIGWTPGGAGTGWLCAYMDDGADITLARAALPLTVKAAPGAPGAPSAPATPAPAAKPANVSKPRVKRSRGTLVCKPGRWSGAAGGYTYAWFVGGSPQGGARGHTLKFARSMRRQRIRCTVTASNAAGSTTAVSPALVVR